MQLNSDPEVVKYIHKTPLKTLVQSLGVIQDIIYPQDKLQHGRWAIYLKETNEFMGWCWGNGYAIEAAMGTIQ